MSRVDDVLKVIDAGLQTPVPDPTFGEVSPKNHDRCARCEHHDPAEGGDLCDGCRAFLLDDSDEDPKLREGGPVRWSCDRWVNEVRQHQSPSGDSYVVVDEQWVTDEAWDGAARRSLDESIDHPLDVPIDPTPAAQMRCDDNRHLYHLSFDIDDPPETVVGRCQCGEYAAVRRENYTRLGIRISVAFEQYADALNRAAEAVQGLHIALDPEAIRREQARQRERSLLDHHRRSQRRTNRWGRP